MLNQPLDDELPFEATGVYSLALTVDTDISEREAATKTPQSHVATRFLNMIKPPRSYKENQQQSVGSRRCNQRATDLFIAQKACGARKKSKTSGVFEVRSHGASIVTSTYKIKVNPATLIECQQDVNFSLRCELDLSVILSVKAKPNQSFVKTLPC